MCIVHKCGVFKGKFKGKRLLEIAFWFQLHEIEIYKDLVPRKLLINV